MPRFLLKLSIIVVCAAMLCGCNSDDNIYTTYSRYKASFSYNFVMTTTPLKNSLVSPGEFCTIHLTANKRLVFSSLHQTEEKDITASAYYQKYVCLSGFIVGLPNMPDLGKDGLATTCYDLACSNCYKDDAIMRNLTLQEAGLAYCSRCKRKYNLNSQGVVCGGEAGRPLERYHISYDGGNILVIHN